MGTALAALPFYWSFVNSAGSQSQLTETLAGISITAMVLVLSPLFLGPRAGQMGVERQGEIRDLFKFLLIAFTTLVTASMLWGQLNGYGQIESKAWESGAVSAQMIPMHVLFLSCSSLTTMGVVALSIALLELVLLSMTDPARLTKLVIMMYAVIVSMASVQVLFGSRLALAELRGSAITDQAAIDDAMIAVPVVILVGVAPALRSLWRSRRQTAKWRESTPPGKTLRRIETAALLCGGLLSALAVQEAPEIVKEPGNYGGSSIGLALALVGAAATLLYACLMWWALWGVTDRLSASAAEGASTNDADAGAVADLAFSNLGPTRTLQGEGRLPARSSGMGPRREVLRTTHHRARPVSRRYPSSSTRAVSVEPPTRARSSR